MSGQLLSKCLRQLNGIKYFAPLNARAAFAVQGPAKVLRLYPSLQRRTIANTCTLWSRGMIDADITHALDEELSYQTPGDREEELIPLRQYLDENHFELQDKEGSDEITLRKRNGDEEITIVFSLSSEAAESTDIDQAMGQDDIDTLPEEVDENESDSSVAVRVAITKKDQGTMAFDIIAKEESISIINVDFHEDRSFLLPESAHQNRRGRRRYLGPNYLALDVTIQEAFQKYLVDKVMDQDLLHLICKYTQLKRIHEYNLWLKNVGNFTDN
ncbi:unnamed protein product [Umbelopsis vinacea]